MAGSSNLYLEPIINGAVGDMGTNIAAMNTQLSETTRILMNILNNQGLEQHQEAYNGATFSGLTLTGDTSATYNYTMFNQNSTSTPVDSSTIQCTGGNPSNIFYTEDSANCDLREVSQIKLQCSRMLSFSISAEKDGITTYFTVESSDNYSITVKLSEEEQKQYDKITFNVSTSQNAFTVTITYTGGAFAFKEYPHMAFNANNLLVPAVNTPAAASYTKTITGYITIPDIQGVATWVSAVLKGNLDGVSVALVDNSTHELIKVLPTATSDISDVQELSGLALMVTFAGDGNSLKYMSGFSMRYY